MPVNEPGADSFVRLGETRTVRECADGIAQAGAAMDTADAKLRRIEEGRNMSTQQALTPQVERIPAPTSETAAVVGILERAVRDPSIDLERLERLIGLQERMLLRQAEERFDAALSQAQSEMRPVAADSNNPQTKSKYASYFALDKALRPIYTRHGFSLSFNTSEGAPESFVRVRCRVAHSAGHGRDYQIDMPADGKGAKGGDVMTKTHATGSAVTYGMRYLLKMIFNTAVGEDDDDGNAANGGAIAPEQVEKIKKLTLDYDSDTLAGLLKYIGAESIEAIPAAAYDKAIYAIGIKKGQAKS